MYRYRVRGMYATAIAKLLMDAGAELVDLSKQLAERFGLDQRTDVPPHATVKVSDDDSDMLVVVGYRDAVEFALYEALISIPFTIVHHVVAGPYTTLKATIKGVVDGKCLASTIVGDVEVMDIESCESGKQIYVHVVKVPHRKDEMYVVRPGIAVVRDTVTITESSRPRVSFSEFVKDFERKAELMTLSQTATRLGYSVKWRSAARAATLEKMSQDLDEALYLAGKVREIVDSEGIYVGESIAFIRLSKPSKEYLDEVRRRVLATTPYHHEMKACNYDQNMVELLDFVSGYVDLNSLCRAVEDLMVNNIKNLDRVYLNHVKPDGEKISIGPAYVQSVVELPYLGKAIVLKRVVRSEGVYDGLNIAKEPGDEITTFIPIDRWFLVHIYTSKDGQYKGMYININTPPELCAAQRFIKYIDLYVDIVKTPDGEAKIIDMEQLMDAVDSGVVQRDVLMMVEDVVDYMIRNVVEIEKTLLDFVRARSSQAS